MLKNTQVGNSAHSLDEHFQIIVAHIIQGNSCVIYLKVQNWEFKGIYWLLPHKPNSIGEFKLFTLLFFVNVFMTICTWLWSSTSLCGESSSKFLQSTPSIGVTHSCCCLAFMWAFVPELRSSYLHAHTLVTVISMASSPYDSLICRTMKRPK